MKAVLVERFGPVADARLATVADPEPGPGEALVAVHAAEANYADILVIEGRYQNRPALP